MTAYNMQIYICNSFLEKKRFKFSCFLKKRTLGGEKGSSMFLYQMKHLQIMFYLKSAESFFLNFQGIPSDMIFFALC